MTRHWIPFIFTIVLIFGASNLLAQNPRLQAIHNAADPGLNLLDVNVYLPGPPPFLVLSLEDVPFRSATESVEVPLAGIPLLVEGVKQDGTVVLSFLVSLETGHNYIGLITGVENPAQFLPNPDGRDISVDTSLTGNGRTSSTVPGEVQFIIAHGVTDAPTLDVKIQNGNILADNLSYKDISPYISLTPGEYTLDVTDETGTNILASFTANLSAYADSALVVFASGFLDPTQNQNGEDFRLYAALPSGTVFELPRILVDVNNEPATPAISDYRLAQNYPNPFNPTTTIEFAIPSSGQVRLSIFNTAGQEVETLLDRHLASGIHRVQWNARAFPSGVYFYRLWVSTPSEQAKNFTDTKKLMLLK